MRSFVSITFWRRQEIRTKTSSSMSAAHKPTGELIGIERA
jgi:hypothetical protein